MESCAEILLIQEIMKLPNKFESRLIRITGFITSINDDTNVYKRGCVISHKNASIHVDCELVDTKLLKIDGLFQFFGHVVLQQQDGSEFVYLRANIIRNVEGLNLALFEEALLKRREYLTQTMIQH